MELDSKKIIAIIKSYAGTILFFIILIIYAISMLVYPAVVYKLNWIDVHEVWMDWQTYNAAIVALIASIIAYKATTYQYHKERANNYRAAKSLLPHALSDICDYIDQCVQIHQYMYHRSRREELSAEVHAPLPPTQAISAIVECIRFSDIEVGDYLAKIVEDLQLFQVRATSATAQNYSPHSTTEIAHIKYLATTRFKINELFDYARNEKIFSATEVDDDDLNRTVVLIFGIRDIPQFTL